MKTREEILEEIKEVKIARNDYKTLNGYLIYCGVIKALEWVLGEEK